MTPKTWSFEELCTRNMGGTVYKEYCVEERNFVDAKYMREDIDGRAIFDQLSDARSDVEM